MNFKLAWAAFTFVSTCAILALILGLEFVLVYKLVRIVFMAIF